MYESMKSPPLPPRHFLRRVLVHLLVAFLLLGISLAIGMWGYGH